MGTMIAYLSSAGSSSRKENTQITQKLPTVHHFLCLKSNSPISPFFHLLHSRSWHCWVSLSLFSPCPSFRKGNPWWKDFSLYHPLWVLLGFPKPLIAGLSHALWKFWAHRDEIVLLSREICLCNSPEGYFGHGSWKPKLDFWVVDAWGTQKQKTLFSFI